ncbi:MAG: metallophosphatase family protein [Planctomycetota bacterium]|nr:MAG: metallophosphatase family protein [Planctomycetota bacterium]
MRYAIISDIHGNLEALETVLAHIEQEGVEQVLCLGDVVGYNANPKECLDLVRAHCAAVIQGNHERMVLGEDLDLVHPSTRHAIEWTRQQLDAEDLAYIAGMPERLEWQDDILLVHGSPRDRDEYILTAEALRENFLYLQEHFPRTRMCLFGHSHFPMIVAVPQLHAPLHETTTVKLEPGAVSLVNPGSVGQPRDGCPLASFAIYDTDDPSVTVVRCAYPIVKAQQKVRAAGLHERIALRLGLGR